MLKMRNVVTVGILLYLLAGVACGQEVNPPVDYLIDFADYTFHLGDEQVRCLAVFGVTVFPSDKFHQVLLFKNEVSPESVRVNDKDHDLTPIGGWLCFLPKEAGSYTVEVEFLL